MELAGSGGFAVRDRTAERGLCGKAKPAIRSTRPKERGGFGGIVAERLARLLPTRDARERRETVLRYVQPGLTGLIDGSISTLAPIFAVAFATHNDRDALLVGLAASIGAGISMGFAEGLADDGTVSGRGSPKTRGVVCGLATALGGLGHTLPYLIGDFRIATTLACAVVFAELWLIAWIRTRFMDTPFSKAMIQIVVGGAIVLATGIAIGSAS